MPPNACARPPLDGPDLLHPQATAVSFGSASDSTKRPQAYAVCQGTSQSTPLAQSSTVAGFEDSSFTEKIRARTKTGKAKGPRLGSFYKLSKHLKLAALLKLGGDGLANLEQTLGLASRHLYLAADEVRSWGLHSTELMFTAICDMRPYWQYNEEALRR